MQLPLYNTNELQEDKEYVLKKLGLSTVQFEEIMGIPIRRHEDFKTDKSMKDTYMKLLEKTAPLRKVVRKTLNK